MFRKKSGTEESDEFELILKCATPVGFHDHKQTKESEVKLSASSDIPTAPKQGLRTNKAVFTSFIYLFIIPSVSSRLGNTI